MAPIGLSPHCTNPYSPAPNLAARVGEGGALVEMLAQKLPVGAVGRAGGMGEIRPLSLQGYQPFIDNASDVAKL